jgi:hypothetical protein
VSDACDKNQGGYWMHLIQFMCNIKYCKRGGA